VTVVVIGIGNESRRDDGIGPAVAAAIRRLHLENVDVLTASDDPAALLDAWDGAELAVIVDAAAGEDATPGRLRRWTPGQTPPAAVSSHALNLTAVHALGAALGRTPAQLVVFTVDAADVGHGDGLSPAVAAAVPHAVSEILVEIEHHREQGRHRVGLTAPDQGPKPPHHGRSHP
jgi:hydrogenase maturation protease